ncbi:MAG: F0F1 ATP synthase subunit B [Gammaproteobacteria bacterium]|nr:F0F1 ATP synthase subunit B [Gammaproteobacteria bacterium]MBK9470377.1 F0F1 ATP synthase subunit B [Gammaproteobacteria bacterium]MBP6479557.1 F0F1 ATP synthase subunit B [Pseudomonadales bacterium]MBP7910653.1 F0F1 ATP synthase subunit B [Pseudomonadales bacterium]
MHINLTLIGQSITFLIFVWFCMKFVWPFIRNAMDARTQQIAEGLSAAERAHRDLELAKDKVSSQLKDAKVEAASIIEQANRRAAQIIDEAKERAREEGDRIKVSAQAEIEQESNRAREQLRAQVGALAVAGASRILGRAVDENAHRDIVDQLAQEL